MQLKRGALLIATQDFYFGFRNADFGFVLMRCSSECAETKSNIPETTKSEIRIPKSEIEICVICGWCSVTIDCD